MELRVFSFFCLILVLSSGCATQSATQIHQPFKPTPHRTIYIKPCVDRTDFKDNRNLAKEATRTLAEKVGDSGLFEIAPNAQLVLTCDIEGFVEGSALKRWVMPGWGATQAAISVMVWEKPSGKVLASFRSHSSVESGGFFTIGADHYIFSAAFDDIIKQLKEWVAGRN
jgi:hypothetical protein